MAEKPVSTSGVSLFYGDARACREWLGALAISNTSQAQSLLLDALRVFNRAAFDPLERLKSLELLRERVAFVQAEQRGRLLQRALPLSGADASAWSTGLILLEEMENGYRRCRGEAALEGHAALMAQRTIRFLASQVLHHAVAHRRVDPRVWTRLHREFQAAEAAGIASARVRDSVEGDAGASSVMAAYAHAVLLDALGVLQLDGAQIAFVEELLRAWSGKVKVIAAAPMEGGEPYPLVVDLAASRGAVSMPVNEVRANHRILQIDSLARSIRRRIRALQGGEDASKLALPAHAATLEVFPFLQRLHKRWCETPIPAPPPRVPSERDAALGMGVAEAYRLLSGGRPFEPPARERELTHREKEQIAVFGRVTAAAEPAAQPAAPVEAAVRATWRVVDVSTSGWRVERPADGAGGLSVGKLAAMRTGDEAFLARIVEVVDEADGRVVATLSPFAGKPQPVPVRDARRDDAPWVAGFVLPAGEGLPVAGSFVVPPGVSQAGRALEVWQGAARKLTVQEVVERGPDFDRVRAR
jgi:hypothetical protein